MKTVVILIIFFAFWMLQQFAENYKKQQENRPPMGPPGKKPNPPARQPAPRPESASPADAWQDWIPTSMPAEPQEQAPAPPPLPAMTPSPPPLSADEEPAYLKPVGTPPPVLESEVAKASAKVEEEISRDLASSLTADTRLGAATPAPTDTTAAIMKASLDAAFVKATQGARRMQRPAGQARIRIRTRDLSLLRQSLVMSEVLGRPRAFDM